MNFTIRRTGAARKNFSGFTLIELLVVIAIIALLAAILFPVFARARENARRASCQSNLKQVGIGVMQYVQDFDEKMPINLEHTSGGNFPYTDFLMATTQETTRSQNAWRDIQPYLKSAQVLGCPSATPETQSSGVPDPVKGDTGYWTNAATFSYVGSLGIPVIIRSVAQFSHTADLIIAQEYKNRARVYYSRPYFDKNDSKYKRWHCYDSASGGEQFNNLHFEGGNMLYADGHVKYARYQSLKSGDFGLTPATDTWSTAACGTAAGDGSYDAGGL